MANSTIPLNNYCLEINLNGTYADREASVKGIADYIYTTVPKGNYRFNAYAHYSWIGICQKFADNSAMIFITRAEANNSFLVNIASDGTKRYYRIASSEVWNT